MKILSTLKDTNIVLARDGRCDSPGKSAKFCTYSMIEKDKNLILHFEVVNKREVGLKSPNMERGSDTSFEFLNTPPKCC